MVSLSNHVAISLRLNTRRQTTIATATRLPRCARNDRLQWVSVRVSDGLTWVDYLKIARHLLELNT